MMFFPPFIANSEDWQQYITALNAQHEEDKLLLLKGKVQTRCAGCGKFMKLDGAHLHVIGLGVCHMKERCIEVMVIKIRSVASNFDWRKKDEA
jgi:hypothetical protein